MNWTEPRCLVETRLYCLVLHLFPFWFSNPLIDIFHPHDPQMSFFSPASCFSLLFWQSLSKKLARKEKEHLESEERLGAEKEAKKGVQDSLRERELEVQELQARATGAEASLQKAQAELRERAEEVAKLKSEIGDLEVKHAELKVERKQLEQQREEKESHGAQQQTEISQVSWLDKCHTMTNMTYSYNLYTEVWKT